MAHNIVLEVLFPASLLLKELGGGQGGVQIIESWNSGNQTKEHPGLHLILQMRKVRPGGQMNSKDKQAASGAVEIRTWASASHPGLLQLLQTVFSPRFWA